MNETMTEKKEIEIFIVMDSDGDYAASADPDGAVEAFAAAIGGHAVRRMVKIKVCMSPPAIEDGPTMEIPDAAGIDLQVDGEAAA